MRNIIAHEYADEKVIEINKTVMFLIAKLLKACDNVKGYTDRMDKS